MEKKISNHWQFVTRLRVVVKDVSLVNEDGFKKTGAAGVIKLEKMISKSLKPLVSR